MAWTVFVICATVWFCGALATYLFYVFAPALIEAVVRALIPFPIWDAIDAEGEIQEMRKYFAESWTIHDWLSIVFWPVYLVWALLKWLSSKLFHKVHA